MLSEPGDPEQYFYVGYRELFEKPDRKGYTVKKAEAGRFTLDEARSMTKFTCDGGYGRWYISCEALNSFVDDELNPMEIY